VEWVQGASARDSAGRLLSFAKCETTVRQFEACVKSKACWKHERIPIADANENRKLEMHPINWVSWEDALQFCVWAGGRLPSAKEWIAEASAGGERRFPWGDELPSCDRAVLDDGGDGCGRKGTWPVCSKPRGASKSGLCDMAGNLEEWTSTEFVHDEASKPAPDADPLYRSTEPGHLTAVDGTVCGGSFADEPGWLAAGSTAWFARSSSGDRVGFRCVREAD
jgi:formylglycine-generating enzyme required for sulfatase activity